MTVVTAPASSISGKKRFRMSGLYPAFSWARVSGYGKASTCIGGSCAHSSTSWE